MEDKTPVGKVKRLKPPAEPPQSLEMNMDEQQWIDDTVTTATSLLQHETTGKILQMNGFKYEPIKSAQIKDKNIQQYLLQQQL